ncbi:MAG TPA: RNA polymerase sigma factor [Acidimicrobiia bacterium]
MPPDGDDDVELVARAARGDRDALDALLDRHIDRVHTICARILANREDALDATQEALLAIARGIGRFDGRSSFTTWLYRVTTNAALDEARRRSRRPMPTAALPDPGVDAHLDADVAHRLDLDAALADLPPDFRAALVLRDVADLDYAQIGTILGIPPGTVRSRISRGRAALARALGNPATAGRRPTELGS